MTSRVNPLSDPLRRRVSSDFSPVDAQVVLSALGALELPFDRRQVGGRYLAAIVIISHGDPARFQAQVELARSDPRDILVTAGLADDDWPDRLSEAFGPR